MNALPPTGAFDTTETAAATRFLEVADTIGRQLVRDAIWHGERCSWLIWTKEPQGGVFRSIYRAASVDLYSGVAGIALFLARLCNITGDVHQRRVVRGAARQIVAQLQEPPANPIGLYTGALGAAWALAEIGETLGDDALIGDGLAAIEAACRCPVPATAYDLLGGRAGAIIVLLAMAKSHGRPDLIDIAERFADELVSAGEASPDGLSWPLHAGESHNLLGLSHGTAGIALALFELAAIRPEPRYREAAAAALRYERRYFDVARSAWPDFRPQPGQESHPAFPAAWCHGSTGIGLSRLRTHQLDPGDPLTLPEIDAAIAAASRALNVPMMPGADFSLCHGILGNNELLLLAGERFARADAIAAAQRVGDAGIELVHRPRNPWGCGVPDAGETPSLMIGTAGIGLHYLRLYDPAATPSIALPTAAPPAVQRGARTVARALPTLRSTNRPE